MSPKPWLRAVRPANGRGRASRLLDLGRSNGAGNERKCHFGDSADDVPETGRVHMGSHRGKSAPREIAIDGWQLFGSFHGLLLSCCRLMLAGSGTSIVPPSVSWDKPAEAGCT